MYEVEVNDILYDEVTNRIFNHTFIASFLTLSEAMATYNMYIQEYPRVDIYYKPTTDENSPRELLLPPPAG